MDFIRLHTLNLTVYDAVMLFDADVAVVGDLTPVLRCAAQDYMLSTIGPNSPMNLGFVAFKPDARLLSAALHFAAHVEYDKPPRGSSAQRRACGEIAAVECVTLQCVSHAMRCGAAAALMVHRCPSVTMHVTSDTHLNIVSVGCVHRFMPTQVDGTMLVLSRRCSRTSAVNAARALCAIMHRGFCAMSGAVTANLLFVSNAYAIV